MKFESQLDEFSESCFPDLWKFIDLPLREGKTYTGLLDYS